MFSFLHRHFFFTSLVLNVSSETTSINGIVHFENNFAVLAYLKGIQDVGVLVSAVVSILIFLGQTILVCQSYNAGLWSPPQKGD